MQCTDVWKIAVRRHDWLSTLTRIFVLRAGKLDGLCRVFWKLSMDVLSDEKKLECLLEMWCVYKNGQNPLKVVELLYKNPKYILRCDQHTVLKFWVYLHFLFKTKQVVLHSAIKPKMSPWPNEITVQDIKENLLKTFLF